VLNETCDSDNDGIVNTQDAFPFDATETLDTDLDGIGNNTDIDDDNDSVLDEHDLAPMDDSIGVGFNYSFVHDGIEVDGCTLVCPPDLIIPEFIDGHSVTGISDTAFEGNNLTSVSMPESINKIGQYAFNNNQLTSVTIPEGVTHIRTFTFRNNQLSNIDIPDSVTIYPYGGF